MPQASCRIGCVLMAAGSSERFHSNKLNAMFNGKTLFERALDVVPVEAFYQVLVVSQYMPLIEQAHERGFLAQKNDHPNAGLSHTIALAIGTLHDADALLFLVADQPLLRKQSIRNAISLYRANPDHIIAMAFGERRGNPCIFPRAYFPELFALEGDTGGMSVIKQHEDKLLLCYAQDGRELMDVDTVDQLYSLIR
ncbi:nucleotidyltransferase family protein [Eubacteriales bacterium OttesenSCG-928-K08]|nr:nucleotidyltransferase family protein [Eubacteriales bacterium OttesenSCG-928-K08]